MLSTVSAIPGIANAAVDVTDIAPTEMIVTADKIPAMILFLILLVFFMVFTPLVVVVRLVLLLTVLVLRLNKFFIVISPFGGRYPRALRLGFSLDCDYSISG